jgi:hypothetical protein
MHGPALPLDVHCEWILNGEESEPTLAHIPPSWYYQPVNYSKTPEY